MYNALRGAQVGRAEMQGWAKVEYSRTIEGWCGYLPTEASRMTCVSRRARAASSSADPKEMDE